MAATEPAAACQAAPVKPAAPLLGLTILNHLIWQSERVSLQPANLGRDITGVPWKITGVLSGECGAGHSTSLSSSANR
jgi:hypothetical protein